MNWACAMVGGVTLLATIYYIIWGRKSYTPPNETVEDYIQRGQMTTTMSSSGKELSSGLVEQSVEAEKRDM
jgi:hypothetical protein